MDIQPLQEVPTDLSGGVSSPDEVDEEGVRYKVLTVEQAQALWDAGAQASLRRTHSGYSTWWREEADTNNPPDLIEKWFSGFRWRIAIE